MTFLLIPEQFKKKAGNKKKTSTLHSVNLHCYMSNNLSVLQKWKQFRSNISFWQYPLSAIHYQSLPRVVGPYTLSINLCQRQKSSPVFSDHVIVKLSCDQTGSSQNGGLTTCGIAFSMNTPVKRLKIECFVCNTPNNTCIWLHGIDALYDWSPYKK